MYFPLPFTGRELIDVARSLAGRLPDRETVATLVIALVTIVVLVAIFVLTVPFVVTPPRFA